MQRIKFIFSILTGCLMAVFAAGTIKAQDLPGTMRNVPRQALAFYYGWYGNPATSGRWVHWEKVDATAKTIGNSTHYPVAGPYDSHDAKLVSNNAARRKRRASPASSQAGMNGMKGAKSSLRLKTAGTRSRRWRLSHPVKPHRIRRVRVCQLVGIFAGKRVLPVRRMQ